MTRTPSWGQSENHLIVSNWSWIIKKGKLLNLRQKMGSMVGTRNSFCRSRIIA